jgi:hypothetical protein
LPVKIVFVHDFSYQDNERFDYLGNKCGKWNNIIKLALDNIKMLDNIIIKNNIANMPNSYWECVNKYYICQEKYNEALSMYRNILESKGK